MKRTLKTPRNGKGTAVPGKHSSGHIAAVVVGASAGGIQAVATLLSSLPCDFRPSVLVVQHRHPLDRTDLSSIWASSCQLQISEPVDKQALSPGNVYVAPANYHMLVERDSMVSLSVDEKVNWSRPSVDVLFESAARAWGSALIAVVLTGSNSDGAKGVTEVRRMGGRVLVQSPATCESAGMPEAAIATGCFDAILPLDEIGSALARIVGEGVA